MENQIILAFVGTIGLFTILYFIIYMISNGIVASVLSVLIIGGGWGYIYKDDVSKLKKKYIDQQVETSKKQNNTKKPKNT